MIKNKKWVIALVVFLALAGLGAFIFLSQQRAALNNGQKAAPAEDSAGAVATRDQIAEKDKWDLGALYLGESVWQEDFNKLEQEYLPQFSGCQGRLGQVKEALRCLRLRDEAQILALKIDIYATSLSDEDTSNSTTSEMMDKADSLYSRLETATAFMEPELTSLEAGTLKAYLADPDFSDYSHYFDSLLKKKAHILSEDEEGLLAQSSEPLGSFADIFSKLADADLEFPVIKDENNNDYQLSEGRFLAVLNNSNRDFRERAYKGILGSYIKYGNTLAEILNGKVKKDIFYARARKYDAALDYFLDNDKIDREVYGNLVNTTDNNVDYLHRYITLRKKVLKLDSVHQYDMYLPLAEELNQKFPFDEARAEILAALEPLGEQYVSDLNRAFEERWADVYETENKYSGAYCTSVYGTHPFILLNYTNEFGDVRTTAHELGHALNFSYVDQSQPYPKAGVPGFVAEIPSTTNEVLLLKYLINNARDDNEKLYYLNAFANMVYNSFYTQVMFSEFELAIHERVEQGEALSAESLSKIWGDIVTKYYGEDYFLDDEVKATWARIPHFYNYNFYVYRYATSTAAANEFAKRILDNEKGAREKYGEFLTSGSVDYPLNILEKADINMRSTELYDSLFADFDATLGEMERILKKQGRL